MSNFKNFPEYRQLNQSDCGPTCLKIVSAYYGKHHDLNYLRKLCDIKSYGTSFNDLVNAGHQIGLRLTGVKATISQLLSDVKLPAILHFNQDHFVVVYKATKRKIFISDPENGLINFDYEDFKYKLNNEALILLLIDAVENKDDYFTKRGNNKLQFLASRLKNYKQFYARLSLALVILIAVQIALPFLTQSLVDYGIGQGDMRFINLIVFAQIFLIITVLFSKIIREQILLRISIGFTKNLLNEFVEKILQLPLKFMESKNIGDFIQRVKDHDRIQAFLNQMAFTLVFDLLSIAVFSSILAYFDIPTFLIFVLAFLLLLGWSSLFLKKQAILDQQLFRIDSEEQSQIVQLVNNCSEIKLNGSYNRRRLEWQKIQISNFKKELQVLNTEQRQYLGGLLIKDVSAIVIVFLSAKGVVDGSITFGTMLAIQFIVGSLSLPVSNLLNFINEYQKTSLSVERILDLLSEKPEVNSNQEYLQEFSASGLQLRNLNFCYSRDSVKILDNINLKIPKNKITAIVGQSGSGKSTLLKILLKLYQPTSGSVLISDCKLKNINTNLWQSKCGAVLQSGRLFDDTIERNITESKSNEPLDQKLLNEVVQLSQLGNFIDGLPLGLQTKVGENSSFISGGEKQRIMIARALYKKPKYLFLDEATSSLDSKNERLITHNIMESADDCTIVIAAHRLSTVKSAYQIVVIDNGKVLETGNHESLVAKKGAYYELLSNQL